MNGKVKATIARAIGVLMALVVVLAGAQAVPAAYIGPIRASYPDERNEDGDYIVLYRTPDSSGGLNECTLITNCNTNPSWEQQHYWCGGGPLYPSGYCSAHPGACWKGTVWIRHCDYIPGGDEPAATCSGTANCGTPGTNGWCRGGASVSLSANDPLGSYLISYIEGNQGGADFPLCDPADAKSVNCTWPAGNGLRTLNFWAHSTKGDTSTMGSVDLKVDTTYPTGSLVINRTPNAAGWINQPVTVAVNGSSDTISGVAASLVQVNGGAAQNSPVYIATDGNYSTIGTVRDNAGNQITTNSITFKLDATPPTITVIPDRVPEGSGGWYKGPVTVGVTGTDNLSGYSHTDYQLLEGGTWVNGTMPVTITSEGVNNLGLTGFDIAGSSVSTSAQFRVDLNPPSAGVLINGTLGENGWYVSNVNLGLNATDAGSGVCVRSLNVDNAGWISAPVNGYNIQGNHSLQGQSQDCVGRMSPVSGLAFKLDTIAPGISMGVPARDGKNNWFVNPFTVTVSGSDATSGVAREQVQVNGGSWVDNSVLVTTEGSNVHLAAQVDDYAGNGSSLSAQVNVDLSDPSLSLSESGTTGDNGWYVSPVVVNATASDAVSGLGQVQMNRNGGAWANTTSLTLGADGTHQVDARAEDNAGRDTEGNAEVRIDQTLPTLSTIIPAPDGKNNWYIAPATFGVSGSDATSGLALENIRVNGGAWQDQWVLVSGEGVSSVDMLTQDNAGNQATETVQASVDLSDPIVTVSESGLMGEKSWYVGPVDVSVAASDAVSGMQEVRIQLDGGPWVVGPTLAIGADGDHWARVESEDVAGRITAKVVNVLVDQTPPTTNPTVEGKMGNNGWYVSPVTLKANAEDATSGLASVLPSKEIVVKDTDKYVPEWTVRDVAGNEITTTLASIKVDATAPAIGFDPEDDILIGVVTLSGRARDAGSGLEKVEVSVNGGLTWTEVTLNPDGTWEMPFDTLQFPGGDHLVKARAEDEAGNVTVVDISTVIGNVPPRVKLSERWLVWQNGLLEIKIGDTDYEGVKVGVCDYENRWPCVEWEYKKGEVPTKVIWDGRFGSMRAPIGEYRVWASIWDRFGQTDTAQGIIIIPPPGTGTPTATMTPTITATPTVTKTGTLEPTQVEATPVATATATLLPAPTATPAPLPVLPPKLPVKLVNFGPYLVLIGFCFALGASVSRDRRPREWRRLAEQLSKINNIQKSKGE